MFYPHFGLQFVDNKELQEEWWQAKRANKLKLVRYIKEKTGFVISPDALFDIQVSILEN
jgi:starch phosphorylase